MTSIITLSLLVLCLVSTGRALCTATPLGPTPVPNSGVCFSVWAPHASSAQVVGVGWSVTMASHTGGVWVAHVPNATVGASYNYVFDGHLVRLDPRAQAIGPNATHSIVHDTEFDWTDGSFRAAPLARAVVYELHVPSFTPNGTLDSAVARLDHLVQLGVTHIELMVRHLYGALMCHFC